MATVATVPTGTNPFERVVRRVDAFQQHHRFAGLIFGVIKKFGDDRAGSLAALMAYYGFLAMFPLLLFLTTLLGFVLRGNSSLKTHILNSALRDFPIIGPKLLGNNGVTPLKGSGLALIVGLLGLLWGGLGVTQIGQYAMAQIWNVPGVNRPSFKSRICRGFVLIATLGLAAIVSTVLASVSTFGSASGVAKMLAAAASVVVNVGLFVAAFRIMTPRQVATKDLVPGAVIAGMIWSVLQATGGYLVGHQLRHADQVYGFFGTVLGLISWLYLGAQVTLYAAEFNVVRSRRLWPRSMVQPPLTAADEAALSAIAMQEERRPEQDVHVTFDVGAGPGPNGG
jgi:YihY family inner membrane protein